MSGRCDHEPTIVATLIKIKSRKYRKIGNAESRRNDLSQGRAPTGYPILNGQP